MPRFAANLSMMYTEVDFIERFGACAADGFKAVEFPFPYAHPAQRIRDELGYEGWIGCEYRPRGKTSDGLGWMRASHRAK